MLLCLAERLGKLSGGSSSLEEGSWVVGAQHKSGSAKLRPAERGSSCCKKMLHHLFTRMRILASWPSSILGPQTRSLSGCAQRGVWSPPKQARQKRWVACLGKPKHFVSPTQFPSEDQPRQAGPQEAPGGSGDGRPSAADLHPDRGQKIRGKARDPGGRKRLVLGFSFGGAAFVFFQCL